MKKTWIVYRVRTKEMLHFFLSGEFHLIRTVLNEQAEIGEDLEVAKLKFDAKEMQYHFGNPPYNLKP